MGNQTAVRRGPWKLVLDGVLVEGAPADDAVHLSDLRGDPGERVNLRERQAGLTVELEAAARTWRAGIEKRWRAEFSPETQGTVTHPSRPPAR